MRGKQRGDDASFTAAERAYIRSELDVFFSTYPSLADGFTLKVWRGGPNAGQPKIPPACKSLIERGLLRIEAGSWRPVLFFTEAGLDELRSMMRDRRFADPVKFAHIRQELGIDPPGPGNAES